MSHPLRHRLAGLAAAASLQALLLGGSAHAQTVRIFEAPPPIELLRSIMVPESQPGLTRRIVITNPDRPAPMATQAVAAEPDRSPEPAPAAPARQPHRQPQQVVEPGPVLASARVASPPPAPMQEARPAAEASPPAEAEPATAGSVGFRINFALDSDVVPRSAYPFIDRIAELLREQPQVRLQVEGHTDALGSEEYNLDLSRRRAEAVAAYLMQRQGIDVARLAVIGLGEEAPLTANPYDPRNRRVQFARVD